MIVPQDNSAGDPPQVGDATTEFAALAELKAIASRNKRFKSYIGMGYIPPCSCRRSFSAKHAGKPGLVYRPYPLPAGSIPGRLSRCSTSSRSLWIRRLDIASASLDEATAAAEAMAMAKRVSKLKSANRFVAADAHPQNPGVVRTRAETFGFDVIVDDADKVLDHRGCLRRAAAAAGTPPAKSTITKQTDRRAESAQSDCQRRCRLMAALVC